MLLYQLYTACEPAAWGATRSLGWECSGLGIRDPTERAHPDRTHAESAAVIVSLHENAALDDEKKLLTAPKKNEEVDVDDKVCQTRATGKAAAVQEGKRKGRDGESPAWNVWILREQQRVRVLFRSNRGAGGVTLFNCIVPLQGRSQFAKHIAESIVNTFSQSQSRRHRVPMMVVHVLGVAEVRFVTCCAGTSNAAFHCHGQDVACACLKRPPGAACASSHREK